MVSIAADNPDIERTLEKLVTLIKNNGAEMADDLSIIHAAGDFRVEASPDGIGKPLIKLTSACLVPESKYILALEGDDIVIKSAANDVLPDQTLILETMLALFNQAGKVRQQRDAATVPFLAANNTLQSFITRGRGGEAIKKMLDQAAGPEEDFLLQTLAKSRTLSYQPDEKSNEKYNVFMPVNDLLNHHYQGSTFNFVREAAGRASIALLKSQPVPGSRECFACYGPYDALDTQLLYNYADTNVPFVRSIPMEIIVPGTGTLKIAGRMIPAQHPKLSDRLEPLKFYIPNVIEEKARYLGLTFLLIPGANAPNALRNVLSLMLSRIAPEQQRNILPPVLLAEEQIINSNRRYYLDFKKALQALPDHDTRNALTGMCDIQLRHLDRYSASFNLPVAA